MNNHLNTDHKMAKKACEKLEALIEQIELLLNDPNNFTYEEICELERQLQLKHEELKKQIDDEFDKLFDKLEEYKQKCKNYLKTNEYIVQSSKILQETEKNRLELREWQNEINMSNEPNRWKKIKFEIEKSMGLLENKIEIIKEELLLREIDEFKFQVSWLQKINIDEAFTDHFVTLNCESSIVVEINLRKTLFDLCKFNCNENWTLIYRGSRDGFGARDFHMKCDNRPKTLTVIKADTGNIFGGYTEKEWDKSNLYKTDYKAFLFSLINSEDRPCRLDISKGKENYAISCSSNSGPIFGLFEDYRYSICINDISNIRLCYASIGSSFVLPSYCDYKCNCKYLRGSFGDYNVKYERNNCRRCKFLGGNYEFKVTEIEVFQKE